MGFFKGSKEDFSQVSKNPLPTEEVNALGEVTSEQEEEVMSELSKLDGLLEQVGETSGKHKKEKVDVKKECIEMDSTTKDTNVVLDETSVISGSTVLTGDLTSAGSFNIQGTVNGNVSCNGKLVVTGSIHGNSTAAEFFADVAQVNGEILSTGTVKIGAGSVIVGNITATSAVIAGAVKGDIDVQGPVVIDTSAVIIGNIKSRSVQINNGAIIEGFCSQTYSDIDVQGIFAK